MALRYPPGFYDEETVSALAQAFREVWKTAMTNDPFRDSGKHEKLRQTIVQTMLDLINEGVLNADELRDRTLAEVVVPRQLRKPAARPQRRRSPKAA